MKPKRHSTALVHQRARRLRHEQTDAERKLWQRLRARSFQHFRFRRQFPIGNFIIDFCCRAKRLVIELDGGQHAEHVERDVRRTKIIAERGYRVIRFRDDEVLTNIETVLEAIMAELERPAP